MAEYRDIGYINNYPQINQLVDTTRRGQVYQATHKGERVLPFMYRSFISFTFGGKRIEDFNLIATISGDRLNRPGYASFNDTVTTYDNLDGQHYWATHYKTNLLDFTLSTDGIDLKLLDNFLHWFRAGATRELILAEHPNRAIMARVSEAPRLNLLPFESSVEITISSEKYQTKTTLYKGDIDLSLVMDLPHWYAIVNILGKKIISEGHERYVDLWDDENTGIRDISIFASLDALKILYEDGIPLGSMIDTSMLLGNGAYANVDNTVESLIWSISEEEPNFLEEGHGARINGTIVGNNAAYPPGNYVGIIAGALVDASDNGIISLNANLNAYFFYAGTAPAYTTIIFTLTPSISNDGYISVPQNNYVNPTLPYNEIIIESVHSLILRFTTPNFYTSYNKVIDIFKKMVNLSTYTWEDVRIALRNLVRHAVVREYAITLISNTANSLDVAATATLSTLESNMSNLLKNNNHEFYPATFTFNSETGDAFANFSYNLNNETHNVKEDVGDMLRSNYIILLDRNYPTDQGKIIGWVGTNDTTKSYSHRLYHNVESGLTNILVLYKNMYL